jgi:hypothetical protein
MTLQSVPVHGRTAGASPTDRAPDPAPPAPPHQSLVEATGETMPPHHVPSLTRLCRDKLERMIGDPSDRDFLALVGFVQQGMPCDAEVADPVELMPKISLLAYACTIGPLHLVKFLVDDKHVETGLPVPQPGAHLQ